MMNCQELRERMFDHSELDALSHAPEVVSHLESCPGCRERMALERRLAGAFLGLSEKPLPAGLANRIRQIQHEAATPDPQPFPFWFKMLFGSGLSLGLAGLLIVLIPRATLSPTSEGGRMEMARAKTEQAAPAQTSPVAVPPAAVTVAVQSADAGPSSPISTLTVAAAPKPTPVAPPPTLFALEAPTASAATGGEAGAGQMMAAISERASETRFDVALAPRAPEPSVQAETKKAQPPSTPATPSESWIPNPHLGSSVVMNLAKAETSKAESSKELAKSVATPKLVVGKPLLPEPAPAPQAAPMVIAARPLTAKPATPAGPPAPRSSEGKPDAVDADSKGVATRMRREAPSEASDKESPAQASGAETGQIFCMVDENAPTGSPASPAEEQEKGSALAQASLRKTASGKELQQDAFAPVPSDAGEADALTENRPAGFMAPEKASSDGQSARIEAILRAHHPDPAAGPIDIDSWVLSKWITVKERIELAPPRHQRWVVSRSGKDWRVVLEAVPEN